MKLTITTITFLLSSFDLYASHIDLQKSMQPDLLEDPVYTVLSAEHNLSTGALDDNYKVFINPVSAPQVTATKNASVQPDKKKTLPEKQSNQSHSPINQSFASLWGKTLTSKKASASSPNYFSELTHLLPATEWSLTGLYQLDLGQLGDITEVTIHKMNTLKSALNDLDDLLTYKLYQAMGYLGSDYSFGRESTRFDEALKRDDFFRENLQAAGLANGLSHTAEASGFFAFLYDLPKLLTLTNILGVLGVMFFLSVAWRVFRFIIIRL
ncbi:MAG: hypothetical protein Q7U98_11945 [Methylicorpusculum sp.]|uniref:hypothetical protein n=2 Tax=Methylicorpusculum sp. TaxID=2713644 RepID=UPI0027192C9D|nr:hypothetical protein [Methylicorpusculum sp.]MDO8939859.1 hypothetical protein [Methylicorpusculum sp.]MDO9240874.1 hypothetical protein [Methylicorpusculum sp.]MDP2178788.1 hypothetical protein [Methylicorpusculum sp.]MDP2202958.1 hypothetical protein [Methylicorpusculum sp.]MDP3530367.1 hypothetical protein [Methylicorpusculum sp.]